MWKCYVLDSAIPGLNTPMYYFKSADCCCDTNTTEKCPATLRRERTIRSLEKAEDGEDSESQNGAPFGTLRAEWLGAGVENIKLVL